MRTALITKSDLESLCAQLVSSDCIVLDKHQSQTQISDGDIIHKAQGAFGIDTEATIVLLDEREK